eukprot:365954-Pyramimonas_sp.AAC.1
MQGLPEWIQGLPGWNQGLPGWIQGPPGWIQGPPGWVQGRRGTIHLHEHVERLRGGEVPGVSADLPPEEAPNNAARQVDHIQRQHVLRQGGGVRLRQELRKGVCGGGIRRKSGGGQEGI